MEYYNKLNTSIMSSEALRDRYELASNENLNTIQVIPKKRQLK